MESYAVVWIGDGGVVHVGRLELTPDGLGLAGAVELEIPFAGIVGLHVGRSPDERIGGRQTLVLDLAEGGRVRIASVGEPGTLHELAERTTAAAGIPA